MEKCAGQQFYKNVKTSQVCSHEKMPTASQVHGQRKYQKCIGQQLCIHVNATTSQVCSHRKIQKCIGQQLCKNDNNSQVRSNRKLPKTRRSLVMKKIPKIRTSTLTEKCHKNCRSPWSQKNVEVCSHEKMPKTSQVHGHGKYQNCKGQQVSKMTKSRRSTIIKNCQKLAGLQSQKNSKFSQVHWSRKTPKMYLSAVMQKCHKLAGPLSRKNAKSA